jgi:hypothetical protein
MKVSGQLHALVGFSPRYPLNRRLGGPKAGLDMAKKRKILAPTGNRTPAVQTVV